MSLEQIYKDIKCSFDSLWKTKIRGETLEIITPYASISDIFISVFITQKGSEYIITDGGWLCSGVYNELGLNDEECFLKVLNHFQISLDIKETVSKDETIYYYVKTSNPIDIPSKVFDLAIFIQNILSISEISFETKDEKETKARFISKANEYLKSFITADKIKLNQCLIPGKKEIKFNALYYNSSNKITLINYITGSTVQYFANSIFKANTMFEMAEESILRSNIAAKVSIIDTNASGFVQNKIGPYLSHLDRQNKSELVNWNEKEKLQEILN